MDNIILRPERESTIAKIAAALASGEDPDELPEAALVPRPTWHRWKAKAANAPGAKATLNAMKKAKGAKSTAAKAKEAIVNAMAASCCTQPKAIDMMTRATHALEMIDELERLARNDDGSIKDPEIFADAVKLNLTSLSTIAKVTAALISGKRILEIQSAITDAVRRAAPESQAEFVSAIRTIQERYGMVGPGERSH